MPEPIRLAMIGAGVFARQTHIPSILALGDTYRVAAVTSRTEASARELAALVPDHAPDVTTDLDGLLARDDIDAVNILLPIPLMPEVTRRALASGKHVISEKPIASTVADGYALATTALKPGQVWMVGENWRYEPAYVEMARLVREGAIGRVLHVSWSLNLPVMPGSPYYGTAWRRTGDFPGGFLLDGGVHHIAALRMIVGEIVGVSAMVAQMRDDLPPADTLSAALRFANGALGTYAVTYAAGAPWSPDLLITGERGTLRGDRQRISLHVDGAETVIESRPGGVESELRAFAAAIHDGRPHRNTPQEALRDLAVIEAMLTSAATSKAIVPEA